MFLNDPSQDEFYPRRIYTHSAPLSRRPGGGDFCIMNNAASMAWRNWRPETGIPGLCACLRDAHQPKGDGSDAEIEDVAIQMTDSAMKHGHIRPHQDGTFR